MDDYLAKPFFPEQLVAAVEPGAKTTPVAAQTSAAPEPRETFNREQALARAMNNEVLLKRLIDTFLANLPNVRAELRDAMAQRDGEALYRAAHKLKGSAATFSAPACTELAREVEMLAQAGDLDGVHALMGRLNDEIERLIAALSAVGAA